MHGRGEPVNGGAPKTLSLNHTDQKPGQCRADISARGGVMTEWNHQYSPELASPRKPTQGRDSQGLPLKGHLVEVWLERRPERGPAAAEHPTAPLTALCSPAAKP